LFQLFLIYRSYILHELVNLLTLSLRVFLIPMLVDDFANAHEGYALCMDLSMQQPTNICTAVGHLGALHILIIEGGLDRNPRESLR
jgi:hypothetical protein